MTAARPARSTFTSSTVRNAAAAAGALLLGIGTTLAEPYAAAAAPAPCEQAGRYAAESGSNIAQLNRLDLRPIGVAGEPTTDVALGEAKSALIADAAPNAAAVTRLLDAADTGTLNAPLIQSAPPTHRKPTHRTTAAAQAGPFTLGTAALSSHAQWDPGMACGAKTGDVTRAEATLTTAEIADDLVRVPGKPASLSTTAIETGARTVARSGVTLHTFDLLGGAVRVKVARPPALVVSMSTETGGDVRYVPAVLEISGQGFDARRLDTAGEDVEIALDDQPAPPDPAATSRQTATPDATTATDAIATPDQTTTSRTNARPRNTGSGGTESATLGDLLAGLPRSGGLTAASPLPIPPVPGVPQVGPPAPESTQSTGPGTRLHISLGEARRATSGHAIAARVTAIKIVLTRNPSKARDRTGYSGSAVKGGGVVLDLDLGVLEAAAVAPESRPGGGVRATASGGGGGLPITGPAAESLAVAGAVLLVAGIAALTVGRRRRRTGPHR